MFKVSAVSLVYGVLVCLDETGERSWAKSIVDNDGVFGALAAQTVWPTDNVVLFVHQESVTVVDSPTERIGVYPLAELESTPRIQWREEFLTFATKHELPWREPSWHLMVTEG